MSNPRIATSAGLYKFTWDEEAIAITVSRVKQHSDGKVIGEIKITTAVPGQPPGHLYQSQFNFVAGNTRTTLAKTLAARMPECQWATILEQLSVHTLRLVREGEPVQRLLTSDNVERPRYLLNPLVIENYPNVIFGDPGAAKSTLAVVLIQMLQLPWTDNPLGWETPQHSVPVLYLDWETDAATIIWQTKMLSNSIDGVTLAVDYRRCAAPLADDLPRLQEYIADTGAQVVLIDSLGPACGGDLNLTAPPLAFYAALRQLPVTPIILAHNAKDRETKKRTIYGNQMFTAEARNVWELRKSQEEGSSEMYLGLFHQKSPPTAKHHTPIGMRVIFDDAHDRMTFESQDARSVGAFMEQMGVSVRIVALLRDGKPRTSQEITADLQVPAGSIRTTLMRMRDQKKAFKVEGDKWALLVQPGMAGSYE